MVNKDIVYSGDVPNMDLLASPELLWRLSLRSGYAVVPLGEIRLGGKGEALGPSVVQSVDAVA